MGFFNVEKKQIDGTFRNSEEIKELLYQIPTEQGSARDHATRPVH